MKYNQLTAADRGAIEILLQQNYTLTAIAKAIGFSKSTVSREINQRSTPRGYVAWAAQLNFETKRKRCKQKKRLNRSKTQKYIVSILQRGWSPEQIAGRMKLKGRDDQVCHETIYAWIYKDKWAYEDEKLYRYLRYGQKKRKKQNGRSVHRSKNTK